ncbi:PREDICTED: uncharacterized protein At3g43530-like [Brassica oleracea var. oleracea]|uniref:uncharacterized protein At3g43530-like n=1 Tax=Brassica oleracea var. oleracea TaxID=109376 RepID=UPI0006A6C863|nr:PREDICTED: uncharacterized protein At3g43530-like [Brassica oleracea var. oleracea]
MDDLDACRSFPWGRLTFEDAIKEIKHVMNHLKGEVLAFECIPDLGKTFRIYSDDASEDCPRICKSRFTKSSLRGYPLEDIYAAVGDTKVINSVLVPTIDEKIMLARIIDEEREYDRQGSLSDTWNYRLNVKQKNIWWKELYELDQAARGVLPKKKDKENVTFAEGSSSNSGLDSRLQGLEERTLEFMGEGFVGLHKTDSTESKKEPSHDEDIDFRQWDYGTYEENDKANAEQEAEKDKDNIENTEQEADRKNENSDEEEGEEKEADDNAQQEGEKEKENIEADEQDKEDSESESESETDNQAEVEGKDDQEEEVEGKESETREQEKEKSETNETEGTPKDDHNELRFETNRTDETPTPPRGNQTEGTPTPPRGRTKEMAARRLVTKPMEEEIVKEKKNREKVAEEEKKEEEVVKVVEEQTGEIVKEQAGEIVEEYTGEEKQRWIVVGYKEAPSSWIMYKCKENAAVAVP